MGKSKENYMIDPEFHVLDTKPGDQPMLCQCKCECANQNGVEVVQISDKKEEWKHRYKRILSKFAENTTAHGFGQLVNGKQVSLKVVWILIMVGAFVVFSITIQPLFIKYLSRPTTTKITLRSERQPTFPVIVICNENMVKNTEFQEVLKEINRTEDSIHAWQVLLQAKEKHEFGHSINHLITKCSFQHHLNCTPTGDNKADAEIGWISFWHWKYGACNAFNTGTDGHNGTVEIKKSSRIGPHDGLQIKLNIEQEEYLEETETAGVRLFIGEQGAYYNLVTQGISLAPGNAYNAIMKKRGFKRVDPFQNNSCRKDTSTFLQDYTSKKGSHLHKYNSYLCESLCAATTIVDRCGCIEYSLPINNTQGHLKMCGSHSRKTCVEKIMDQWDKGMLPCSFDCSPACEEVIYNLELTSHVYPSAKIRREMMGKNPNIDPRDNMLQITFYFKELEFEYIEDEVYYVLANLLSDIGGQMGLFNGFSFLTIFEFLFLFLYIARITFCACIREK